MAEQHGPLYAHLHELKAANMVSRTEEKKAVISLLSTDNIETAVSKFNKNNILSCPVKQAGDDGEWVGFIDYFDVLKYIATCAPADYEFKADELKALNMAGRVISLVPVSRVVDFDGKDPMVQIFEESPASMLVDYFTSGIHRALLFNREGDVCGIVSQSDIVKHMATQIVRGEMKHIAAKSLQDLGYAANHVQVETANSTDTVLQAIKLMAEKKVSVLGVVDSGSGRLVGNFSASDVRSLYRQKFPNLLDSLQDYLRDHSPKSLNVICGRPESSLLETVQELTSKHLHHLWVVDDEFRPSGLVTLTDIMHIIKNATL